MLRCVSLYHVLLVLLTAPWLARAEENATLTVWPHDVDLKLGDSFIVNLTLSSELTECVNISLTSEPKHVTELYEGVVWWCPGDDVTIDTLELTINTSRVGKTVMEILADPPGVLNTEDAFVRVSVMVDPGLNVAGDVLGWIYTIAWDISFLPQIIHNFRRHSVVGLSFDFLTFNFIGFFSYFIFNMGLLWVPSLQAEFHERNPTGVLHVRLNDVIFPMYALVCTAAQIVQCFLYKREPKQRVSYTCRIISAVLVLSAIVFSIVVPFVETLMWLDLLYWLSYIKLIITAIKYAPQLWENYRRKSTDGWSIYQVILDFTGGTLSLVQMFLLAGNYDDWLSILLDPAKLGLGMLSIFFNIFFFIQHYCLYRNARDFTPSSDDSTEHMKTNTDEAVYGKVNPDATSHM